MKVPKIFLISAISLFQLFFPATALAIYDPLSQPNNKIGIHVLHPDEIDKAANLVNDDSKNAWGYLTVPIQAFDRDRIKWTRFMLKAREQKVIPIIRIATFANGPKWEEPDNSDLIDFANFLNDLPWPVKNRYVIIFNEVNRPDEYGGTVSPQRYAEILVNASNIFKERSENFFILPAGLDNAAPNKGGYMRWDLYIQQMYKAKPEVFEKIDGWTSHAYPNPDFASSPLKSGQNKIDSFRSDLKLLAKYTSKKLPVFITETGWSNQKLSNQTIASYYQTAFKSIWNHPQIVAITPFLLFADSKPFDQFSLLNKDYSFTPAATVLKAQSTKGEPLLEEFPTIPQQTPEPEKQFVEAPTVAPSIAVENPTPQKPNLLQRFIELIKQVLTPKQRLHYLQVGSQKYQIETVTSMLDQEIGLAKYQSLPVDHGMLFPYKPARSVTFWMKNMKFDIDIVWIKDDKVVAVTKGLFDQELKLLPSPGPIDAVLEVNINSNINPGDPVTYSTE